MFLRPGQIQGSLLLGTSQAEVSSLFFPDPASFDNLGLALHEGLGGPEKASVLILFMGKHVLLVSPQLSEPPGTFPEARERRRHPAKADA